MKITAELRHIKSKGRQYPTFYGQISFDPVTNYRKHKKKIIRNKAAALIKLAGKFQSQGFVQNESP